MTKNPLMGTFLYEINQFYIDFYQKRDPTLMGANMHDALTICYLLNRDLFTVERGSVCVSTEGIALGATIFDNTHSPHFVP